LTQNIGLENAGVKAENNGKLKVTDVEETNVPHIFGIGDVIYG
jgi:pyruvate/2-oxoglutarate dehydrogenase complex dihydrolipoamide dehydrogenase (E3) component